VLLDQRPRQGHRQVIGLTGSTGHRLWRLRKLHQFVDAELREHDAGVEVLFFYNGQLSYGRQLPTLAAALSEAAEKRADLEREGWMFHW
jgi:hypothetical protein